MKLVKEEVWELAGWVSARKPVFSCVLVQISDQVYFQIQVPVCNQVNDSLLTYISDRVYDKIWRKDNKQVTNDEIS